jgi:hypothetical protein
MPPSALYFRHGGFEKGCATVRVELLEKLPFAYFANSGLVSIVVATQSLVKWCKWKARETGHLLFSGFHEYGVTKGGYANVVRRKLRRLSPPLSPKQETRKADIFALSAG